MSNAIQSHSVQTDANVKPSQILVMGPQASAFANALIRLKGHSEIFHAETAAEAIKLLGENEFDHVLVDNRTDGALTLTIPRLAQLKTIKHITVLAGVHSAETIAAIPGIGQVITPPYNPLEIANSLGIEVKDSRQEDRVCDHDRRKADEATTQENNTVENEEKDDRPALFKVLSAIVHFIPGLTPILSMLYKNIALTILAALFVAFVSYGSEDKIAVLREAANGQLQHRTTISAGNGFWADQPGDLDQRVGGAGVGGGAGGQRAGVAHGGAHQLEAALDVVLLLLGHPVEPDGARACVIQRVLPQRMANALAAPFGAADVEPEKGEAVRVIDDRDGRHRHTIRFGDKEPLGIGGVKGGSKTC